MDEPERADATRRTRLANERTYLAWWRSALAAFAVGVGFGGLPHVAHVTRWPFVVVGILFVLLGIVFVGFGSLRQRAVESALDRGEFSRLDPRVVAALAVAGVVLGVLAIALVLVAAS
jgi:putative membrane protein